MRFFLIQIFLLLILVHMFCQSPIDSSQDLRIKDAIIPSVLIGYGLVAISSNKIKSYDVDVKNALKGNKKVTIDNYMMFGPPLAVYGLNWAGTKGKSNLKDYSMVAGMSVILNTAITLSIKNTANVLRPDGSTYNSFPSGHTSTAFVAAELFNQEYGQKSAWYSVVGYSIATATGALRIYNNRHWFSDVVAGAGIGILSTRTSYWLYPKIKKWFTKKDSDAAVLIFPTTNGLGLVYQLK
jgi:membrane-associated phospholipid phosphatase